MKLKTNRKGLTLIEIIISIAIISIIAVTMLNVLGTGFSNVFRSGKNSKDYYESAGELEIATMDPVYRGKQEVSSITNETVTINVFGKAINTRFIKSKIGELGSALNSNDKYLFIYAIDETLHYTEGQAFISKDKSETGSDIFQLGRDIPISKELLEGNYKYNGEGRLIIPSKTSINLDTEYPINWTVKEGIYIKPNVNLEIKSTEGIVLKSLKGHIILNESNISSGGKIIINAGGKLELRSTIVQSESGDISFEAIDLIDVSGTTSKPTVISVKSNINEITFKTNEEVLSNNYTMFKKDERIVPNDKIIQK